VDVLTGTAHRIADGLQGAPGASLPLAELTQRLPVALLAPQALLQPEAR